MQYCAPAIIAIISALHKAIKQQQKNNNLVVCFAFPMLAGQFASSAGDHLSLTTPVASYKNYSSQQPAPVTHSFFDTEHYSVDCKWIPNFVYG